MNIADNSGMLDQLVDNPLFDSLDSAGLRQVANYLQSMQFRAGETLFSEGDEGTYACFIVEGQLDVRKENEMGGEPVLIAILSGGRSIGEMSIIDESPRSASVVARSDGKALLLHRDRFGELLEAHPAIGVQLLLKIARLMSLNLRKTSAVVAELLD